MPFDVDALSRTDFITNKSTPIALKNMDDDEWIQIRSIRDALEDFNAQILSMKPDDTPESEGPEEGTKVGYDQDPDVLEAEKIAEEGATSARFLVNEGMRYLYIWRYMCLDFNCFALASPEDRAAGKRRGRKLDPKSIEDKDALFRLVGEHLLNILAAKDGATPTPEVKGPDGNMAGFPGANKVGDTGKVSAA